MLLSQHQMRMKTQVVYPLNFCLLQFFSSYAVGCYPVVVYRIDPHAAFAAPDDNENGFYYTRSRNQSAGEMRSGILDVTNSQDRSESLIIFECYRIYEKISYNKYESLLRKNF
ncbi:MAG: hypothetical protein GX428_08450 [Candidatus Atribacteria bacterium]|nr:hypothetical protein [Candidatus Atribacteria bacterium]